MEQSAERFIEHRVEGGATVLYLTGAWRLAHLEAIARALAGLGLSLKERYVVDGSRLRELDTAAGFTLFRSLARLGCTEAMVSTRGFDARHRRLLALVQERMQCPPAEAFRAAEALLEDTAALAEAHTGADLSSFRQALAQRRRPLDPPPAGP